MTDQPKKITFLGTGLMGAPMATRLLAADFELTVWNRNTKKTGPLAALGAKVFTTAAQAAEAADIVITMLTDGDAVADVLFGADVAEALNPGAIVVDMSSIRPVQARDHAARLKATGQFHLDAPVSGGTKGAEAGTLAIMVGGDSEVFDQVEHIFKPIGRALRVGPPGTGQLAKLANQAIVAIAIGAVAEATLLVAEGGGNLAAFRAALKGGFADSTILQQHGERMEMLDFEPGGRSSVQVKDLDNVLAEAEALGLTLPLVGIIRDRFKRMIAAHQGGDLDHSALYLDLLDINGRST